MKVTAEKTAVIRANISPLSLVLLLIRVVSGSQEAETELEIRCHDRTVCKPLFPFFLIATRGTRRNQSITEQKRKKRRRVVFSLHPPCLRNAEPFCAEEWIHVDIFRGKDILSEQVPFMPGVSTGPDRRKSADLVFQTCASIQGEAVWEVSGGLGAAIRNLLRTSSLGLEINTQKGLLARPFHCSDAS